MDLKKAYQEKADAQLRDWQGWIEQLKSGSSVSDQIDCIEQLDDCHLLACTRLEELRASDEDRWELSKQALERAMIELKRLMNESGVEYTGKVIPLQHARSYPYEPFFRKG